MKLKNHHADHSATPVRDRSLTATGLMILFLVLSLLAAYLQIRSVIETRSLKRMEEGVNTVIEEVTSKLERESLLLNATANILASNSNFNSDSASDAHTIRETITTVSPLLETMRIRILLPDNQILSPDGAVIDASGADSLSFETEAPLGEHISNRVYSVSNSAPILRHFVPIQQNGATVALLYGITRLDELPSVINVDHIYNASARVYIVDTQTGDFLMDTGHDSLGNLSDFPSRETQGSTSWDQAIQKMRGLQTGYVLFFSQTDDEWQYLYYAPAGINQWSIMVSVPEREAFSSVYTLRRVGWVIGILMALSITIYYLWVSKNAKQIMERTVSQAVLTEKLQKAEAADRAKSTFLSNMSHDIRTPMNAIIGFATLAEANLDSQERVQNYLTKILSSSNHLLSLINDILDMSRIESGKLHIEEKPCSISDIFRDMRNIIQNQMQAKQINFFMDTIDVIDEEIFCDKLHVNQVLLNLLSNAIKFTPPNGTVSLTIRQIPDAPAGCGAYEIRVKDTGIGMSPEFAQHIFEPFEREHTSTVSGIQGTGLGMAITKNIVDAMGGSIKVHTQQGKGSEFVIHLNFRLQSKEHQIHVVHHLEGLRALVVDDSFSTCDSITKMLRQIGMRPEWTMYGKEGVLRAKQAVELNDPYSTYIIDWVLPDLSGLEAARQIRTIVGDRFPIIVITACDWAAIEEDGRDAGVTAFCHKPIFLSELRDTLIATTGGAESPHPTPHSDPDESFRGVRLLLVEDNELNREIAEELLSEHGFLIDSAEDGSVAVDKITHAPPHYYALVLMDIQMPIMNGYDAARAIRALPDPALSQIPIVAMTANAFEEDRKRSLECGMNAHVAKPINMEVLMDVLRTMLR